MFHCAIAKGHGTAQRRAGQPLLTLASKLKALASGETIKNGVQLSSPQRSGKQASSTAKRKITTHPNDNVFLPLEFGDISVTSGHLGTVEGPESAHHFDGALRRVGHLPRFTNGNSPTKYKYSGPWFAGTAVQGKREAEPLVSDLRFRKDGLSIFSQNNLVFLLVTSRCCYEAMIPVDQRLATSPLLLLWMWFTMTSSRRHSLCCCNGTLNYPRTATKEAKESRNCTLQTLYVHTPNVFYCVEKGHINRH